MSFDDTCARLEEALSAGVRSALVEEFSAAPDLKTSLLRLRNAMKAHTWPAGGVSISLAKGVRALDQRTREEGFHVLHDWDGKADRVNEDIIPIDVLDYIVRLRGAGAANPTVVSILLDYYFVHLLQLLSVRAWDEGDADANLDRLGALLATLQGPGGSGHVFASDAETLILIATSHFEMHERGYETLLARVRMLSPGHQMRVALGHAASMGSHLRFGFEATYGRDTVVMRDDNVADYPWLCYAVATLMAEYDRQGGEAASDTLVEALLNGFSADARALVGQAPSVLGSQADELGRLRGALARHRPALLTAFAPYRPDDEWYSPIGFFFNFSHNVVKGAVVDALLRGQPWSIGLNDLLTALPRDRDRSDAKVALATTLMGYARANPDRIRGRLMPVIVYDPTTGRQAFSVTINKISE